MIAKQVEEIIYGLKTETRRTGACAHYIVNRSQAVTQKMYQPSVWYRFMPTGDLLIWPASAPADRRLDGWTQLRVLILEKRVERLWQIDSAGATAEGILCDLSRGFYATPLPGQYFDSGAQAYACLWDSINGKKKGFRWSDNPEIKVIRFKRVVEP